ncbi:hypothetical protein GGR57DRAFT_504678 [Xylariaceae sp. FL1272]|nr:hypothetical protein GGR57DRAFT_504678 [Xylariaceae sp. FL1272]
MSQIGQGPTELSHSEEGTVIVNTLPHATQKFEAVTKKGRAAEDLGSMEGSTVMTKSVMNRSSVASDVQMTEGTQITEEPQPTDHICLANESPVPRGTFRMNDLPTELRWMIWNIALLQEAADRFVLLTSVPPWTFTSDSFTQPQATAILPMKCLVSPFLSACRESRKMGLEFYPYQEKVFKVPESAGQLHYSGAVEVKNDSFGTIYIHPQRDKFFHLSPSRFYPLIVVSYLVGTGKKLNAECRQVKCSQDIRKVVSLLEGTKEISEITSKHHGLQDTARMFPNISHWFVLCVLFNFHPYVSASGQFWRKGWAEVVEKFEWFNHEGRIGRVVKNTEHLGMDKSNNVIHRIEPIPPAEIASAFDDE